MKTKIKKHKHSYDVGIFVGDIYNYHACVMEYKCTLCDFVDRRYIDYNLYSEQYNLLVCDVCNMRKSDHELTNGQRDLVDRDNCSLRSCLKLMVEKIRLLENRLENAKITY